MAEYLRGKIWYIDYYASNGKRYREKVGPSRKQARIVLKKRQVEIAEGRFLDVKKKERIRFEDFAVEYLENHSKLNNRSWQTTDLYNIKRLNAYFSGKFLHDITPLDIEKFKDERFKEVKPATVNRCLALLKSIFNKAIHWKKFEGVNPVRGIKFYKEHGRLRFLEKEEVSRLLNNCSGSLRTILIVALNTGMRRAEIFNLKWHDIDFKRDIISLDKTKNEEKRLVPINQSVKEELIRVPKNVDSPYVFTNKDNKPFYNLRKSFFTACKKSDIVNFRFHDLRHTFASQLVMAGVDLNTIRELLGHKSIEMTLRYSHLSPDHKKRAVDVLGQHLVTNKSQSHQEVKEQITPELVSVVNTIA